MRDPSAVLVLHEQTKHGGARDRSRLTPFRPLDPSNRPAPFKLYRGAESVRLARDVAADGPPAAAVLSGRARADQRGLDVRLLSRLLHYSAGVTRVSRPAGREPTWFRASMSAGNLHPVELYVACSGVSGLAAGLYHYAPLEHGLTRLREGPEWARVGTGGATVVLTGIPWRTGWKYGERGYRHLWWDAGGIAANLLAVAEAAGIGGRVRLGFDDASVARLVGVDGTSEMPLALVDLGPAEHGAGMGVADSPSTPPVGAGAGPVSARPVTFPLLLEAHRSGDLFGREEVRSWQRGATAYAGEVGATGIGPPSSGASRSGETVEAVIRRRGSTRLMRREPATGDAVRWGMAVASRPPLSDAVAPGTGLVEHHVSVHALEGIEPGGYRWRPGGLDPERPGDLRELATHLCLDQPLGGDSVFAAFHCSDLERVIGSLGARGYRVAHFEAGLAAGRLQLAAFALGLGATGLTFYDDEVSRALSGRASCLLVTAVGVPAYRSVPGGGPGHPAELAGFDRLMARLAARMSAR